MNTSLISQPERKVTWYWDAGGNTGKTFLADWLDVWRDTFVVTGGKYADIAYAFNYEEYIVFDYARDYAGDVDGKDRFPYKLLEDFKNKRVFSTKYRCIIKKAASCHLIVFTNFAPDRKKLSPDRWDVHRLGNGLGPMENRAPVIVV